MEKLLVKSLLYPIITEPECRHLFADQYAFRPTESTTSALISHFSPNNQPASRTWLRPPDRTRLLQRIWFGQTLQSRLQISRIRSTRLFYNWVISSGKHQTKAGNVKSTFRAISASIIQGSGLGRVSYVFTACDLHALFSSYILLKYADDTYLIVPAPNSALGITFNNTQSSGPHVNLITAKADASFYALKTLKSHGLSGPALWDVCCTGYSSGTDNICKPFLPRIY